MITLYAFGPFFDLPDASPYVMKTEIQLRMAGLAYEKDFSGFPNAPKGKLPYIADGETIVADSTFIRAYLEQTRKFDLDAFLSSRQRAEAWAIERMIEDHLSWGNTHVRWIRQENFDKGPAQFFKGAPDHMREKLRADTQEKVRQTMWGAGMGRHAEAEILELMTRSLTALSEILGDRQFLMGDNPCGADAIAIAMLAGLLTPYFESELRRRAESFDNLSRYVDRGMARYYPAHAWPTHEARIAAIDAGKEIRAAA